MGGRSLYLSFDHCRSLGGFSHEFSKSFWLLPVMNRIHFGRSRSYFKFFVRRPAICEWDILGIAPNSEFGTKAVDGIAQSRTVALLIAGRKLGSKRAKILEAKVI